MAGKYWREAATLILIGKANYRPAITISGSLKSTGKKYESSDEPSSIPETNYNILCMKRSSKSSFMPNSYVFPGGAIDPADKTRNWMNILKHHGYNEQDLLNKFRFSQGKPVLYSNKLDNELLSELAFRICALRETFEETGVLLASSNSNNSSIVHLEEIEREKWRVLVQNDPNKFLELFESLERLPAIFDIHEWDGWLTPTTFKSLRRRFDTAFFISFLDHEIPIYQHNKEADDLKVDTPHNFLHLYYSGQISLEAPQVYQFQRLVKFIHHEKLKEFALERAKINLPRWLPVIMATKDGLISILPGDDLYPAVPDYIGVEETRILDETMEESRANTKNLNRLEFNSEKPFFVFANASSDHSHVIPISFSNLSQYVNPSKL